MFERRAEEPISGPEPDLGDLIRHWSGDSRFGARLSGPDAVWLVLDGTAERILLASTADGLARSLSDGESGRIDDAIRMGEQIRPRALPLDRPSLMKLRFDTRRLGQATTCLALRTKDASGRNCVIVAVLDRLPGHRASPQKGAGEQERAQADPTAAPEPRPSAFEDTSAPLDSRAVRTRRVTWKSDAEDRLTDISGPAAAAVKPVLIGRTWAALSHTRTLLDAEGLLQALAQRRTFRAISVTLQADGMPGAMDLDISGTPIQRGAAEFTGFNGFAMVRSSTASSESGSVGPEHADIITDLHPGDQPVSEVEPDDGASADTAEAVTPTAMELSAMDSARKTDSARNEETSALPVAEPAFATIGDDPSAAAEGDSSLALLNVEPSGEETTERSANGTEPPTTDEDAWTPLHDPHLSSNEHAAFREIARALGARFAGDSTPDDEVSEARTGDERATGGSVTPFPTAMTRFAEPASEDPNAAVSATLERVPGGVMVYRGDSVLFANSHLLAMAGFADSGRTGGIGRHRQAVRRPRPARAEDQRHTRHPHAASGHRLSVDMQASELDWRGAPAHLLLIRDAVAGEPGRERVALQIADAFAGARAADAQAVLDSLDDGVITLDRNGRIIGLNRSAATTFGLDPREVVGAAILSLFAAESAVAVLASVHGIAGSGQTVLAQATPDVIGRTAAGMSPLLIKVTPPRPVGTTAAWS